MSINILILMKILRRKTTDNTQSLKRVQRVLVESICLQTGVNLLRSSHSYFAHVDSLIKQNGKTFAVARLKMYYNLVLNSKFNLPLPDYSFIKTKRNGFPIAVSKLERVMSTPQGIQAVLGLLSYYRLVKADAKPDFSQIMDPPKVSLDNTLVTDLILMIPRNWNFKIDSLPPPELRFRSKRGPNGQATYTCLHDMLALKEDFKLYPALRMYLDLFEESDYSETLDDFDESLEEVKYSGNKCYHSKLSLKREGGGKTRIFAMVDFFTQCALEPLHSKLASILRTIDEDCTYEQGKGSETLKKWTKTSNEIFSYDLKGASDRIPVRLQQKMLESMTGSTRFAELWLTLMIDREFYYKGKPYRWRVGQPLGAYSSWPSFTLAHHLMVRLAAKNVGEQPQYFLLGDDIVILGSKVANEYRSILTRLGIEIQMTKSVCGNVAEFAKRIYYQGKEVSPVPVKMISALVKDPVLITEVARQIRERSSDTEVFDNLRYTAIRSFAYLVRKDPNKLTLIASNPITGCPIIGSGANSPSGSLRVREHCWPLLNKDLYLKLFLVLKFGYFMEQYERLASINQKFIDRLKQVEFPGVDLGPFSDIHPFVVTLTKRLHLQNKAAHLGKKRFLTDVWNRSEKGTLPSISMPSLDSIERSFQKRIKHEAKIMFELHQAAFKAQRIQIMHEQAGLGTIDNKKVVSLLIKDLLPERSRKFSTPNSA